MSLKSQTSALVAMIAGIVGAAAELRAAGAIRPEHDQKFANLRVAIDQANDAAQAVDQAADEAQPTTPDAAAFAELGGKVEAITAALASFSTVIAAQEELKHAVETMALTVDHLSDLIDAKA